MLLLEVGGAPLIRLGEHTPGQLARKTEATFPNCGSASSVALTSVFSTSSPNLGCPSSAHTAQDRGVDGAAKLLVDVRLAINAGQ